MCKMKDLILRWLDFSKSEEIAKIKNAISFERNLFTNPLPKNDIGNEKKHKKYKEMTF